MINKENQTNCNHKWILEREAGTTINGPLPALWKCKKCSLTLTTSDIKGLGKIKKNKPVAIKVLGKLKGSKIENNISIGMRLLEADEIEKSSVRGNEIFLSTPIEKIEIIKGDKIEQHGDKSKAFIENKKPEKESFLSKIFWKFFILIVVGVIVSYLVFKFGWQ